MKRLFILIIFLCSQLHAALQLPINRPSKNETVILELIIKDIEDYINAQKPVAASARLGDARDELRRVKMYMNEQTHQIISDYIKQMQNTIDLQKQYQIKKYGKLLEVN